MKNPQVTSYTELWNTEYFLFKIENQAYMILLSSSFQHYTRSPNHWHKEIKIKIIDTKKIIEIKEIKWIKIIFMNSFMKPAKQLLEQDNSFSKTTR